MMMQELFHIRYLAKSNTGYSALHILLLVVETTCNREFKVIKERFKGKYPARKSIQTNFAHVGGPDGLHFQADAIAYCG